MSPNVVAYACSLVPVEIIEASGLSPARLIPKGAYADADSRIHPNTCCYVRSLLSDLLRGSITGLRGAIFTNSCDAMRKLFDIWSAISHSPAAVFLDVPKKNDPDSIQYFASLLKKLAVYLEERFSGSAVTHERLNTAIRKSNELRSKVMDIFSMQARTDSPLKGSDIFPLLLSRGDAEIMDHARRIARNSAGQEERNGCKERSRIVLTGSIVTRPEFVGVFEEKDAQIVAFDTCFGPRHYSTPVKEGTADPFAALAERYLCRPPCPRMMGVADQVEYVKSLAQDTGAHGVVVSVVKYCDQILYNLPLLQEGIKEIGVPVLVLENDYAWSDLEKVRIKIEAFLETLG